MACENTCRKCTSKGDSQVTIQGLHYNTLGYLPDELVEIGVTVRNNNIWFHADTCACLFDGDVIISTLYQDLGTLPTSSTYTFTFPPFTMGNVNKNMHISIISGSMFYDCTDYRNFVVKVMAPPGQGYKCNPKTKDCEKDTASTTPYDVCYASCIGGTGTTDKVVCDSDNNMNIMGICVPKPLVLGAFALGAIFIFKSS